MIKFLFLMCFSFIWCTVQAADFSQVSKTEQSHIADLIYKNECNRKEACLVSWNDGEDFASLGIGHFIWFPENSNAPFQESFPDLLHWFQSHDVQIPSQLKTILQSNQPCAWQTKTDFLSPVNRSDINALRLFLADTKNEQAAFIMDRLSKALPKMLEVGRSQADKLHIEQQFERVAASSVGWYVLADYVNFKGEGTKESERYQGKGWGLAQVLMQMHGEEVGDKAIQSFIGAATYVLERRIKLSPPERNEGRWLKGWTKRLHTYSES
jgi:hypothetical protein